MDLYNFVSFLMLILSAIILSRKVLKEGCMTTRLVAVIEALRRETVPAHTAVLGLDSMGAPLLLRLASPEVPHVLICGTDGIDVTAMMRSMIASLATFNSLAELGLVLIDTHHNAFTPFKNMTHLLTPVAQNAPDAMATLKWLVQELNRRERDRITLPRIVTFIDELVSLGELAVLLIQLIRRGRQAGMHLVCATQQPGKIAGLLKQANFPARLVGRVNSAEDAMIASGIHHSDAERLEEGVFVLLGRSIRHQLKTVYASNLELASLLPDSTMPLAIPTGQGRNPHLEPVGDRIPPGSKPVGHGYLRRVK